MRSFSISSEIDVFSDPPEEGVEDADERRPRSERSLSIPSVMDAFNDPLEEGADDAEIPQPSTVGMTTSNLVIGFPVNAKPVSGQSSSRNICASLPTQR